MNRALGFLFLFWSFLSVQAEEARVRIYLDPDQPALSKGVILESGEVREQFQVGFGRNGIDESGARFRGGYSLLGKFQINAILSADRFEMKPELIAESGKSVDYLKTHLFANMSSIDFDGDGKGGEYGDAFISLEDLSGRDQPFRFNVYKGKFRWYSYAIHGTQDSARIGKAVTGGCVNVGAENLSKVLKAVKLGDIVEVVNRNSENLLKN
ncbi:MAG: L,D-transpeptidase [Verrucomicrobiota bacterium]